MGPHVMKRPPKFVQSFLDRHGRPRFYLRRRGFKPVALPGLPWSPQFMQAYEQALSAQPHTEIGARRTVPGSMRALLVSISSPRPLQTCSPAPRASIATLLRRSAASMGKNGSRCSNASTSRS